MSDIALTVLDTPIPPLQEAAFIKKTAYDLEKGLFPIIQNIEIEREEVLSKKNIIYLTLKEFIIDVKAHPWKTAAKLALVGTTALLLHPLIIGAIACINSYRLLQINDLYSTDAAIANTASQLFANLGHGVGYLVEGIEISFFTSCVLFRSSYKRAMVQLIEELYDKHVHSTNLNIQERNFLYKMKKAELREYGHFHAPLGTK